MQQTQPLPSRAATPPRDYGIPWRTIERPEERARLLRHCRRLAGGDTDAAEDMVQEVLFEAWRHREILEAAPSWRAFLYGVAQNVHLRRLRREARERARRADVGPAGPDDLLDSTAADVPEFAAGLEREDVADLLDRAMGRLTPSTRGMLVAHYVLGLPQTEVAARFGLADNTAAVRIHRAREALRETLTAGDLRGEAVAHGLISEEAARERWVETRIWCPCCGRRPMLGRQGDEPDGMPFALRCPACHYAVGPQPLGGRFSACFFTHEGFRPATVLGNVTAFKPAINRLHSWWYRHLCEGVARGRTRCLGCGRDAPLLPTPPRSSRYAYPTDSWLGVHAHCAHCGHVHVLPPSGFALSAPPVQRFWKENPRMRLLSTRRLPGMARNAWVATCESAGASSARLEVVFSGDNFEVLETFTAG